MKLMQKKYKKIENVLCYAKFIKEKGGNKMGEEVIKLLQEIREELKERKKSVKFLSRKDVMEMLNYSEATVTKMFRRSDFPSINLGKNHYVEENVLLEWCRQKRN